MLHEYWVASLMYVEDAKIHRRHDRAALVVLCVAASSSTPIENGIRALRWWLLRAAVTKPPLHTETQTSHCILLL